MGRPKINVGKCRYCGIGNAWTKQLCSPCYKREYYVNNQYTENGSRKKHNKNNKSKMALRKKNREKIDVNYKLANRLRHRLTSAVKGGGSVEYLGCSLEDFKLYLESKFESNMSWNNHTSYGWHIDHIIPLSAVDLTNIEELKKVCHYSNLRPLWWNKNLGRRYGKE